MSDIMERTLAALPRLLGAGKGGQQRQSPPSRGLVALKNAVDNARGRSEQDAVVHKELHAIKRQLERPGAAVGEWREAFPRIIFCSVLGYDVSFSHIYALKLAAMGKGWDKRVGYLAATLLLSPACEITMMIMGTLQRDLHSSNILDNLMALSAAAELVGAEIIPLMLPPVVKLLRHRHAMVREKAVYCVHAFFRRAPGLMGHTLPQLKGMLGDKDPGVLSAVVTLLSLLVETSRAEFVSLGVDLINVLQQVQAHKFPSTHNYHGVPLPWLQIKLLKMLACLGSADDQLATHLVPVLTHTLNIATTKEMISLAVVEECLLTIAVLAKRCSGVSKPGTGGMEEELKGEVGDAVATEAEGAAVTGGAFLGCDGGSDGSHGPGEGNRAVPKMVKGREGREALMGQLQPLLEEASKCVARFLSSGVHNLRYQGIKALSQLVAVNAELASHHQMAVLHCLDDTDSIIRRQTLTLLYHMANPANAKVVCSQLLEHIHSKDSTPDLQADVADMVCDICFRLVPDPVWYLHTLLPLFSLPLESHRASSLTHSMLQFFTKAAQDSHWPAFPKLLFTTMVDNVQGSDAKAALTVVFALKVLRFVPLPARETIAEDRFLTACTRLLESERQESAVKEVVVLCVQELLLRSCLDRRAVLQWARSTLDKCDRSAPQQYQQTLRELLALASLDKDLRSLSALKPKQGMDFTLSFADSYAQDMCKKGQTLLKTQRLAQAVDMHVDHPGVLRENSSVTLTSSTSQHSSSTPLSHDDSSLYTDTSLGESCSLQSPTGTLRNLPGVRQVWTKEGFDGDGEAKKQVLTPAVTGSRVFASPDSADEAQRDDTVAKELREKEELAKALFQGLSPSTSVTSLQSSSSQVTTETDSQHFLVVSTSELPSVSNLLSTSSQKSTPVSSQDTLVAAAASRLFSPSQSLGASSGPDTLAVSATGAQSPNNKVGETDLSWSALPPADSSGWKALHVAHIGTPVTEPGETDQQSSATLTSDHVCSDLGSESTLSISDDSLENIRDLSLQNSPAKRPVPAASLHDDRVGLFDCDADAKPAEAVDNAMFAQFLQTHMAEFENSQTTPENVPGCESNFSGSAGTENLYSGFEKLVPYSDGQWEEENGSHKTESDGSEIASEDC